MKSATEKLVKFTENVSKMKTKLEKVKDGIKKFGDKISKLKSGLVTNWWTMEFWFYLKVVLKGKVNERGF